MNRLLRLAFVVLLVSISGLAFGQGAAIKGTLTDSKGPVINATVEVTSGGIAQGKDLTDFDGHYTIKPLNAGNYTVKFTYQDKVKIISDIILTADQTATVNAKLTNELVGFKVVAHPYVKPIIDDENPDRNIKTAKEIENAPTRNIADMVGLSTQVYQKSNGAGTNIGGSRVTGTKYIVDGVQLDVGSTTFTNQGQNTVETIETFSSGVPAKYGDASGGLVTITTKGSTATNQGNIQFQHSVEGYDQNQLTLNLSGPLLRKKDSNGAYRPLVGYSITADGIYDKDQSPIYYQSPVINPDRMAQLQAHPLTLVSSNGVQSMEYSSQLVRDSDISYQLRRPNVAYYRGQLGGKLDFNLTPNVSVRVGGSYFASDAPDYNRQLSLFSPDDAGRTQSQTGRGYIRFTQKFGNKVNLKDVKDNQITNAYYTVQVDYSKDYSTDQDKTKKHNTFDYGYIGKFDEHYAPAYEAGGVDDSSGKVAVILKGYTPTYVSFTPGTQNPLLANYTNDAYGFNPNPQTQIAITANRGLRNGDIPTSAYGLYSNIGVDGRNGWNQTNSDQVAVGVDASFDIKHKKTTHSIGFGLYYQQRNSSYYGISGATIWGLMRQFSNRVVNQEVNPASAHYIINGVAYTLAQVRAGVANPGPNDTILYDRKYDVAAETKFDSSLRNKLFAAGLINSKGDYINTDLYDPSFYSLDMFSADDLLNQGKSAVSYYGYDYTGKKISGNVNFNDFWTATDANGYHTRPIGAYRPNYIAGYISDFVQYKDFRLTFGVRIERFDNNTKVLKDPYSLYAEKKVSDVKTGPGGVPYTAPSNIGGDYIPYVGNNSTGGGTIIGFRNGDTWYDAAGREVPDPRVLQTNTGSDGLQPLLQNPNVRMTDANYDPAQSFTDYTPQVNAMPRINFSFKLNDDALFYAHYDIMYQRPNTGAYATPSDYMFLDQNPSNIYQNSNLKPERAIDYEIGFQQRLTESSGLTISGFYKERKDQIQIRPYLYAFPITYYAYGNRDYSTYKGLSLAYQLQRTNHISASINYTLSFAEGTGSSASSANGGSGTTVSGSSLLQQLIAAGLPNLRTQFPLDYDSRHNINAQIDYRFGNGEGPTIGKSHILQNAGLNLIFRARSGEPYTKYSTAQNLQDGATNSPVIDGTVNGSRLPGHFGFDLNIDKTFPLNFHKAAKEEDLKRPSRMAINVYAYAQNVFNIRDVLNVYGYTGRADDDGFLTSPQGQTIIPSNVSPKSFVDLYNIYQLNPSLVGAPRTIYIGVKLNF